MRQLEAFSAVMTLKTATAAADMLYTSQPSITRLLKQLEYATRLVLFNRVKGKLEPTTEAWELLEAVTENFHGMSQIQLAAEDIHRRKTGYLRIACLPAFSQGLLAHTLSDFLERYPKASVSVLPLLAPGVAEAFATHKINIGIAAYEVDGVDLHGSRFTDCNEVVVMPASHRLRKERIIEIDHLKGQRIVGLVKSDPYRQRLDRILEDNEITPGNIIEMQASAGVCAMAAQGVGIAVVNPLTALDFVDAGLIMRPFSSPLPFVTTLLVSSKFMKPGLTENFVRTLSRRRDVALEQVEALCRKRY